MKNLPEDFFANINKMSDTEAPVVQPQVDKPIQSGKTLDFDAIRKSLDSQQAPIQTAAPEGIISSTANFIGDIEGRIISSAGGLLTRAAGTIGEAPARFVSNTGRDVGIVENIVGARTNFGDKMKEFGKIWQQSQYEETRDVIKNLDEFWRLNMKDVSEEANNDPQGMLDVVSYVPREGLKAIADNAGNLIAAKVLPAPIAFFSMAASERGNAIDGMVDRGVDFDIANKWGTLYGMVSGGVEYSKTVSQLGIAGLKKAGLIKGDKFKLLNVTPIKKILEKQFSKTIIGMLENASEETVQAFLQDAATSRAVAEHNKRNPDKQIEFQSTVIDDMIKSGASSVMMDAVLSAFGLGKSYLAKRRSASAIKDIELQSKSLDVSTKMAELVPNKSTSDMTPEEVRQGIVNLSRHMDKTSAMKVVAADPASRPDIIEEIMFPEGRKDRLYKIEEEKKKTDKIIQKEKEETERAEFIEKTKQELSKDGTIDNVFKSKESFDKLVEADSGGEIKAGTLSDKERQDMAKTIYDIYGLKPEESVSARLDEMIKEESDAGVKISSKERKADLLAEFPYAQDAVNSVLKQRSEAAKASKTIVDEESLSPRKKKIQEALAKKAIESAVKVTDTTSTRKQSQVTDDGKMIDDKSAVRTGGKKLPSLKQGYVRVVHLGPSGISDSIKRDGLDYSKQGMLQSTARYWDSEKDVEYEVSGDRRFDGLDAYVFDIPSGDIRLHNDISKSPGKIDPKYYVGTVKGSKSSEPIQTESKKNSSDSVAETQDAYKLANDWDMKHRLNRSDDWFDGGNVNDAARQGFKEAEQNGGNDLSAHGMSKEPTLSGAIKNLTNILVNGLDPKRGRAGGLDTAPLTTSNIGAGAGAGTASGTAYRDGPFVIVAKKGVNYITSPDQIAAILVNEAHVDMIDSIRDHFKGIRPDIIVEPFSGAGKVSAELTGRTSNTKPVEESVVQRLENEASKVPMTGNANAVKSAITPEKTGEVLRTQGDKPGTVDILVKSAGIEAPKNRDEGIRVAKGLLKKQETDELTVEDINSLKHNQVTAILKASGAGKEIYSMGSRQVKDKALEVLGITKKAAPMVAGPDIVRAGQVRIGKDGSRIEIGERVGDTNKFNVKVGGEQKQLSVGELGTYETEERLNALALDKDKKALADEIKPSGGKIDYTDIEERISGKDEQRYFGKNFNLVDENGDGLTSQSDVEDIRRAVARVLGVEITGAGKKSPESPKRLIEMLESEADGDVTFDSISDAADKILANRGDYSLTEDGLAIIEAISDNMERFSNDEFNEDKATENLKKILESAKKTKTKGYRDEFGDLVETGRESLGKDVVRAIDFAIRGGSNISLDNPNVSNRLEKQIDDEEDFAQTYGEDTGSRSAEENLEDGAAPDLPELNQDGSANKQKEIAKTSPEKYITNVMEKTQSDASDEEVEEASINLRELVVKEAATRPDILKAIKESGSRTRVFEIASDLLGEKKMDELSAQAVNMVVGDGLKERTTLVNKSFNKTRRDVDDLAEKQGYNFGPVYHGTDSSESFSTFSPSKKYGNSFFFSKDESVSKTFGKNVRSFYLSIKDPQRIKYSEYSLDSIESAADAGFDGLIATDESGVDKIVVVFDSSKAKSESDIVRDGKFQKTGETINRQEIDNDPVAQSEDYKYIEIAKKAQTGDPASILSAQEMVDKAAKAAGFDSPILYHGTDSKDSFSVFDRARQKFGWFYFTLSPEVAQIRGRYPGSEAFDGKEATRVLPVYIRMDNAEAADYWRTGDLSGDLSGDKDFGKNTKTIIGIYDNPPENIFEVQQIIENGNVNWAKVFDEYGHSFVEIAVRDPSQIKSAEPVTYDNYGNIVPLSKRFDINSEDVRYQKSKKIDRQSIDKTVKQFESTVKSAGGKFTKGTGDVLGEATIGGTKIVLKSKPQIVTPDSQYASGYTVTKDGVVEIYVSERDGQITTLPHEIGHASYEMLSDKDKNTLVKTFGDIAKNNTEDLMKKVEEQYSKNKNIGARAKLAVVRLYRNFAKLVNAIAGRSVFNENRSASEILTDLGNGRIMAEFNAIASSKTKSIAEQFQRIDEKVDKSVNKVIDQQEKLKTPTTIAEIRKAVMAQYGSFKEAEKAMKSGGFDSISKMLESNMRTPPKSGFTKEASNIVSKGIKKQIDAGRKEIKHRSFLGRSAIGRSARWYREHQSHFLTILESIAGKEASGKALRQISIGRNKEASIRLDAASILEKTRNITRAANLGKRDSIRDHNGDSVRDFTVGHRIQLASYARSAFLDRLIGLDSDGIRKEIKNIANEYSGGDSKLEKRYSNALEATVYSLMGSQKMVDGKKTTIFNPDMPRSYFIKTRSGQHEYKFTARELNQIYKTLGKEQANWIEGVQDKIYAMTGVRLGVAYEENNNRTLSLLPIYIPQVKNFTPETREQKITRGSEENPMKHSTLRGTIVSMDVDSTSAVHSRKFSDAGLMMIPAQELLMDHVNDTAVYVGMDKIFNEWKSAIDDNKDDIIKYFGDDAYNTAKKELINAEGIIDTDIKIYEKIANSIVGRMSAVVLKDPFVMMYQPISSIYYGRYFGMNHFGKALKDISNPAISKEIKEVRKYAASLEYRYKQAMVETPYFSGVGYYTKQFEAESKTDNLVSKLARLTDKGIAKTDKLAIDIGIATALNYVKKNNPELRGDDLYKEAALQASMASHVTQVSGDPLFMSELRQSKNVIPRTISYMTGSISAAFNMLSRDITAAYRDPSRENIKNLATTTTLMLAETLAISFIKHAKKELLGRGTDDDEWIIWDVTKGMLEYLAGVQNISPFAEALISGLASNIADNEDTKKARQIRSSIAAWRTTRGGPYSTSVEPIIDLFNGIEGIVASEGDSNMRKRAYMRVGSAAWRIADMATKQNTFGWAKTARDFISANGLTETNK